MPLRLGSVSRVYVRCAPAGSPNQCAVINDRHRLVRQAETSTMRHSLSTVQDTPSTKPTEANLDSGCQGLKAQSCKQREACRDLMDIYMCQQRLKASRHLGKQFFTGDDLELAGFQGFRKKIPSATIPSPYIAHFGLLCKAELGSNWCSSVRQFGSASRLRMLNPKRKL